MHFPVLATDYDGTIAEHGTVLPSTLKALQAVKESGRSLVLVTGREEHDIRLIFPEISVFDWLVLENGAQVINAKDGTEKLLGNAPPRAFIDELRSRGVSPINAGKIIVATHIPYEPIIQELIAKYKMDHQLIYNKGDVMVLPPGINKGAGLSEVLRIINHRSEDVIAFGDAENDSSLLGMAGCPVAVLNAIDELKKIAKIVTTKPRGEGVEQVLAELLSGSLMASPSFVK